MEAISQMHDIRQFIYWSLHMIVARHCLEVEMAGIYSFYTSDIKFSSKSRVTTMTSPMMQWEISLYHF